MYDLRLKNPSTFILAGPSQSGKTTFTVNLLRNIATLFEKPTCASNVVFFYKQWQTAYENLKTDGIVHRWVNKIPSDELMRQYTMTAHETGSVIIIDDFAQQLNKDTIEMFTVSAHHTNSVVILLTQNIFSKNVVFREISLNCSYVAMFKNPRDSSQINHYAKQFAPGRGQYVIEAFHEATKKPYSYLFFDNHQLTPEILRVRARILPSEQPMAVYAQKSCSNLT